MNNETLQTLGTWAILCALTLAVLFWLRNRTRVATLAGEAVDLVVEQTALGPEFGAQIKALVAMAVNAVDQRVKAYGEMDNAARLALAKRYLEALLDFYGHGDVKDLAREALIEAELWLRHQAGIPDDAPEVKAWLASLGAPEAVPLAEREAATEVRI